jgi:hypothetical protein
VALPITYLPASTLSKSDYRPGDFVRTVERAKQKAPYNVPSKYLRKYAVTERLIVGDGITLPYTSLTPPAASGTWGIKASFDTNDLDLNSWANNSAYDEFKEKVQKEAMLYVNWHERQSAIDSAVKRVMQLYLFTRALRTRSPRQAAMALGVDPRKIPPGTYKRTKLAAQGLGNTWLEWHFGWDPLIKDISSSINILNQPDFDIKVEAKGRKQERVTTRKAGGAPGWSYRIVETRTVTVRSKAGGRVRVSNPNLFMASQLGLINPLAIAWELVPYSFVVDWFANVGTYLQSYTDFSGLTLTDTYTTQVGRVGVDYSEIGWSGYKGFAFGYQSGIWVRRTLGLPSVKLGIRPRRRLGAVRGFTAIALLLNQMRK